MNEIEYTQREKRVDLLKELTELKESIRDEKEQMKRLIEAMHYASTTMHMDHKTANYPHKQFETYEDIEEIMTQLKASKRRLSKYCDRRVEIGEQLEE